MAPKTRKTKMNDGVHESTDPPPTQEPKHQLPLPRTTGQAIDPTVLGNWKDAEPGTEEEMDEWLGRERDLLLEYLRYWKRKAEDPRRRAYNDSDVTTQKAEWMKWEPERDIETGEIWDDERRADFFKQMESIKVSDPKDRMDSNPENSHHMYKKAQGLWEGETGSITMWLLALTFVCRFLLLPERLEQTPE